MFPRAYPRQARDFARATGRLAETDWVDAEGLARMYHALDLAPTPPEESNRARRDGKGGMIRAERNRAATARGPRIVRIVRSFARPFGALL
ncbi:MAG: hypothetical protein AAF183_22265 [Pseudomonadota bacterium]